MSVGRTILRNALIAVAASIAFPGGAFAKEPPRTPLMTALAGAPGGIGWRTVPMSDGGVAAIGSDATAGAMHIVGIACGRSKRPEIGAP
jgi:hypothetical protein